MAAETLARGGVSVTVYERMPSPGRKFLMAGRGGLNLTHSEALAALLDRFSPYEPRLHAAIEAFTPADLRAWCEGLGQETFVGSSGRVFPRSMKASPLLRAWLRRLAGLGVQFRMRHRWLGWTEDGKLSFDTPDGQVTAQADVTVLAMGGASWPNLGSNGAWTGTLEEAGVGIAPLRPSNCGFLVGWSQTFRDRFAGQPLKSIGLGFEGKSLRGEALITRDGIEGGGIYALSPDLREAIASEGEAILLVDLRPDLAQDELARRLSHPRGKQSLSTFLRKSAKLPPVAIGLLRETEDAGGPPIAGMAPDALAALIKTVPLRLTGTAPIARAISTAGGVRFNALDDHFMLKAKPGVFAAGEMLDWEAPTGGYLLQASFATGAAAGRGALEWLSALRQFMAKREADRRL
jgi:uncharacterized flavoprotein (TIGR03862 family)